MIFTVIVYVITRCMMGCFIIGSINLLYDMYFSYTKGMKQNVKLLAFTELILLLLLICMGIWYKL